MSKNTIPRGYHCKILPKPPKCKNLLTDLVPTAGYVSDYHRFVYGIRKDGGGVCIRSYKSSDEEISTISIPEAAAAVSAARGLFDEVNLTAADGSKISFLDKGHPLGLINPTKLALKEIEKLFPDEPVHAIISIGSGDVAVNDIPDLLRLAYPRPFLPIPSMLQRRQVPEKEMYRVNEGLRDPKVRSSSILSELPNLCSRTFGILFASNMKRVSTICICVRTEDFKLGPWKTLDQTTFSASRKSSKRQKSTSTVFRST